MITLADFERVIELMGDQAREDIAWSEGIAAPKTAEEFALETIFVICNSGMKNTIARQIYERVRAALIDGRPASSQFGHPGKAAAIEHVWQKRDVLFGQFSGIHAPEAQLQFLAQIPWIGEITKYHLAKNFGLDVAKPDVHLQRLAGREGTTPQALCERLAREYGYRVATVDTVLWRACATGVLNSRTGEIAA